MEKRSIVPVREEDVTSHILPFLWMKGEEESAVLEEMDKIAACGIREICLESRPHPDFCGPAWWKIVSAVLEKAKRCGMRIWILDDSRFPTGHANGGFAKHPALAKWYLAERHMDILGPCRESAVLIAPFLPSDARLIGVLAFPKPDTESLDICPEGVLDLTNRVRDGFVYFDLPAGKYRLFVLFATQTGGGRPQYMNLIDEASVRVLIDEVYEPHYAHFAPYFGNTLAGFFSDEPEFGNEPGYPFDAVLGRRDVRLPWSRQLEERLRARYGSDFRKNLPALWYDSGAQTGRIRETYMDEATKLVYSCFTAQVGQWCADHGVEYIGHIIEDANASSRLGCSIGHYFREMHGRQMAGIDLVHEQIVPGFTGKIHQWIAGDEDGEFFHYGMAKLAAGEAHIDPVKKGRALVELFGNYGWAEGVSLMRWLSCHMLVSGINEFVPHAFSVTYPDPDCPPHFYARGNTPQYPDFVWLMKGLQRGASLLSHGIPETEAAVVYHAESEWYEGKEEGAGLFQRAARELLRRQIDCDVIPADILEEEEPSAAAQKTDAGEDGAGSGDSAESGSARVRLDSGYGTPGGPHAACRDGRVTCGQGSYSSIILPEAGAVSRRTAKFLIRAAAAGVHVFCLNRLPETDFDGQPLPAAFAAAVVCVRESDLAAAVAGAAAPPAMVRDFCPDLRFFCRREGDRRIVMFFNESTDQPVDTEVIWRPEIGSAVHAAVLYDVWSNSAETVPLKDGRMPLRLDPGQDLFVILSPDTVSPDAVWETAEERELAGEWKVSRAGERNSGEFQPYARVSGHLLPSMNGPAYDPGFTGWYRYEQSFPLKKNPDARYRLRIPAGGDAVLVTVNGKEAGRLAGFPAEIEVTEELADDANTICLQFSTTLVWKRKDGASTHLQLFGTGLLQAPVLKVLRREKNPGSR